MIAGLVVKHGGGRCFQRPAFDEIGEGRIAVPDAAPFDGACSGAVSSLCFGEMGLDHRQRLPRMPGGEVVDRQVHRLIDGVEAPVLQLLDLVQPHLAQAEHFDTQGIAQYFWIEAVRKQAE